MNSICTVEAPGIEPGFRRDLAVVTSPPRDAIEVAMSLSRALGLGAFALLSYGGRSGSLGLAESNGGGAPAAVEGGSTAASGAANGGTSAAGGAANGGSPTVVSSAGSSSGGAPVGPWVTLHHQEPRALHDNPFDYVGSNAVFADVWSDDPSQALIAILTPGFRAQSSGGVLRFEAGTLQPFAIGAERLYNPPRLVGLSLSDLWLAEESGGLQFALEWFGARSRIIWRERRLERGVGQRFRRGVGGP